MSFQRSQSAPHPQHSSPPLLTPRSPSSSTYLSSSSTPPPEEPDSFITHYIYTPLFFASFLLSFLLVDNRNHECVSKARPQLTSAVSGSRSSSTSIRSSRDEEEKWIWRAKHRKMAKLEIGQALEMRQWVALGIVGMLVLGGVSLWFVGKMMLCRIAEFAWGWVLWLL
jgi:hypothetical protein